MANIAEKYDQAMAIKNDSPKNLRYLGVDDADWRLSGFAFRHHNEPLHRLPDSKEFPKAVSALARHTAGGRLDFISNTTRIWVKVKLKDASHMYHMPDTGSCGFDLYYGPPGESFFIGTSRFKAGTDKYESKMHLYKFDGEFHHFTLNFPLYSGIKSLKIGIDKEAKIHQPVPWTDDRPLVFYGSSITQGGCASRPGMAYPTILGRRLNRPVFNFGFSGSGQGEAVVARQLAKISAPSLFLLDYDGNALLEGMQKTLHDFISILRQSHPETPLIVLSSLRYSREIPLTGNPDIQLPSLAASADFQRREVEQRQAAGDKNIYFIHGGTLHGKLWHEYLVDGIHPSDQGFIRTADELEKIITKILCQ